MGSTFKHVFSTEYKNMSYFKILAFTPPVMLLVGQVHPTISSWLFLITCIYFFYISLRNSHLIAPNIKLPKGLRFLLLIYLILGYIYLLYLYLSLVKWGTVVLVIVLVLIYILSAISYFDKVHLIYYFFYKKILSGCIEFLIVAFNYIYNKLLFFSLPLLIFLFSIYLFNRFENESFSNPLLTNLLLYLNDSLYSKFNHKNFVRLFNSSLLLVGLLIVIRYLREILLLIYKYVISIYWLILYMALSMLYILVFTLKGNFNYQDIPSLSLQASTLSLILYIILVPLKAVTSFQWEGKNKLYKKIYKQNCLIDVQISITQPSKTVDSFFEELDKFLKAYLDYREVKRNYFEYLDDNPISLWDKEVFSIKRFTESIFDIINWYSFSTNKRNRSFSIWLVWEWWSWKSSVINSLREVYLDGYPEYKVMEFNPWNFEKKTIIESFFNELSYTIWGNKIIKLFNKYLASLGELHKWFDFLIKSFRSETTLEHVKEELNKELKKLANKKIVVIIDDLDRCEPWEVLVMLNIIKNLWDLTNIIYLVAYDKDNIINVLEKAWFDKVYLDKIINIERYLPKNRKQEIKTYFLENLDRIVSEVFNIKQLEKERQKKSREEAILSAYPLFKMTEDLVWTMQPVIKLILDMSKNVVASIQPLLQSEWVNWSSHPVMTNKPAATDKSKELWVNEFPGLTPETSWYLLVSKEDLLSNIGEKFDTIFERENLRLIKKLLNQLRILFLTNLYTWKEHMEVYAFSIEDYATIVLFNYIKIKDYEWFSEILNLRLSYSSRIKAPMGFRYIESDMSDLIKSIYLNEITELEKEFVLKLFSIDSVWGDRKVGDPESWTIKIGMSLRPIPIQWNLKIILERFC